MKKLTTKKKRYGVVGWGVYFATLLLGILNYVQVVPVGLLFSYMIIFLWLVHYEIEQLDKGLLLLCNGVVFVLFTSTVAGLEGSNGALFAVPEQTRIALVALVMMAGSTFLGAGGSVIANVAADHSSDRTITKNETQSLVNVEAKLKCTNSDLI